MRIVYAILCIFLTLPLFSQVINSNRGDSGNSSASIPSEADINNQLVSGNVDLFSGCWNTNFTLGTVSTLSGLSFSCNLSYSSAIQQGSTFKNLSGLPYGENWNLNIPMVRIKTEDYHRYNLTQQENMSTGTSFLPFVTPLYNVEENPPYDIDCSSALEEGRLYWYAPMISVPGIGTKRFVYKEYNSSEDYFLFLPHEFETFTQAKLFIPNNELPYWQIILADGTIYTLRVQSVNHRQPSNQRVQKECIEAPNFTDILANLILPKTEFLEWYCTSISHPHKVDSINFIYRKYGEFDKFPQFVSPYHRLRINSYFFGGTKSNSGVDKTYEKILLDRIESRTERLVLNYDYLDGSKITPPMKIVQTTDSDIEVLDSFYVKTEIENWSWTGTNNFEEWYRYKHGKSSDYILGCDVSPSMNQNNPYVIDSPVQPGIRIYTREKVKDINHINGPLSGRAPLHSLENNNSFQDLYQGGYLESENINSALLVYGDYYEVKADFSNTSTSLYDINVVSGSPQISGHPNFFWDGPDQLEIYEDCYNYGMNQILASSFSSPLKNYISGATNSSSLFFNLQSFSFPSLRLQIGPSNSDNKFDFDMCTDTPQAPNNAPNSFLTYFNRIYNGAFDNPGQTMFRAVNSGANTPTNFGIGAPWFMLNDYYTNAGLNLFTNFSNPTQANTTIGRTWWNDEATDMGCAALCNLYPSQPLMTPPDAQIFDVKLNRFSELPLVLSTVTKEVLNTNNNWAILKKYGLEHKIELLSNASYYNIYDLNTEANTTISSEPIGGRNILLLSKIKLLPNTSSSTFANTPVDYQTYHFDYEKRTYSFLSFNVRKNFFNEFMLMKSFANPLGRKKDIKYHHPNYFEVESNFSLPSVEGFDADDIIQIPPNADLKSYIRFNSLKRRSFRVDKFIPSFVPDCMGSFVKRLDNGLMYTIYMTVDSIIEDQGYQQNVTDYDYENLIGKLEHKQLSNQFTWDIIDRPYKFGFDETTIYHPSYKSKIPYDKYYFSDEALTFGKIIRTEQYDGNNNIVYKNESIYDTLRIAQPDWENQSSIIHPDFIPTDRMYDVPYFYDTRFPDIYWNSSHFVKMIEQTNTHFLAGDSIVSKTEYEYFDCDFNLNTTSAGLDSLLGISVLNQYPSFNLYRTKQFSPDFPNVSTTTDQFYLYDFVNSGLTIPPQTIEAEDVQNRMLSFQSRTYLERDNDSYVSSTLNEYFIDSLLQKASYISIEPTWNIGLNYTDNKYLKTNEILNYNVDQLPLESQDVKGEKKEIVYFTNGFIESTETRHINNSLSNYMTSYIYNPTSALLEETTDENNTVFNYTYDDRARLKNILRNDVVIKEHDYSNWDNIDFIIPINPICGGNDNYSNLTNQNYIKTNEYFDDVTKTETFHHIDSYGRKAMVVKDSTHRFLNSIYDPYGRVIEEYDQATCASYDSDNEENILNRNISYYDYPQPYTSRISKKGNDISTRFVETEFTIVDRQDIINALSLSGNLSSTSILDGKYYKEKITDEDAKYVENYKDILGNIIMTTTGNGEAATVFEYDSRNLNTRVINPLNQETTYEYNYTGGMFHKVTVDRGDEYFAYDHIGNIIYHETSISKQLKIHDGYSRKVSCGTTDISNVQIMENDGNPWITNNISYEALYNTYGIEVDTFYKKLFYDTVSTEFPVPVEFEGNLINFDNSNNRLRQAVSYSQNGFPICNTYYGYDLDGFGRFKGTYIDKVNIINGTDSILCVSNISFGINGLPKEELYDLKGNDSIDYACKYDYDNRFRLKSVSIPNAIDQGIPSFMEIAGMEYNDENDLLLKTKYFLADTLTIDSCGYFSHDSIVYSYDQQDRLINIESNHYEEEIFFDSNNLLGVSHDNNFNGNINATRHTKPVINNMLESYSSRREGYQYDNFNRLIEADSRLELSCEFGTLGCFPNDPFTFNNGDVSYEYDKIGSITFIDRVLGFGNPDQVMSYQYITGTNKIDKIQIGASSFGGNEPFSYDGYGNTLNDGYNDVIFSHYYRNRLPANLYNEVDSLHARYEYDYNDNRLIKITTDSITLKSKDEYYLQDVMGRTVTIIDSLHRPSEWNVYGNTLISSLEPIDFCSEEDSLVLVGNELFDRKYYAKYIRGLIDIFPADDVSYIAKDSVVIDSLNVRLGHCFLADTTDFCCDSIPLRFKPKFYVSDHLGNVRVKYFVECTYDSTYVVYDAVNDYLPFGKTLFSESSYENKNKRYQYNGKENDVESGYLNYGARLYSSELGRFMSVDPLSDHFSSWSPFNYTLNNPINLIDPDGRAPDNIGVDKSGKVVFDDGKDDGNLFLVNDGVSEIKDLSALIANSIQLTKDKTWIGTDSQLIDYMISQMNFVDNFNPDMFINNDGTRNITLGPSQRKGLSVSGIAYFGNDKSQIKIKIRNRFSFSINFSAGSKSSFISNPYNTRNILAHEGRHIQQYTSIYHRTNGNPTIFNIDRNTFKSILEFDAIEFQKSHPSYNQTTSSFKTSVERYKSLFPNGANTRKRFFKMLNEVHK